MKRGRNQRRRQGVNINRAYDSNGPEVRIRGTANQIYDKYLALARDASSSGDRVKAENYLQHAEHYFRVIRSMQAAQQPPQQAEANEGDGEQPGLVSGQPREAAAAAPAESAEAQDSSGQEESQAASGPSQPNGRADSSEQADAQRRPRRRRPRRNTRPDGEEPSNDSEETAEVAAG